LDHPQGNECEYSKSVSANAARAPDSACGSSTRSIRRATGRAPWLTADRRFGSSTPADHPLDRTVRGRLNLEIPMLCGRDVNYSPGLEHAPTVVPQNGLPALEHRPTCASSPGEAGKLAARARHSPTTSCRSKRRVGSTRHQTTIGQLNRAVAALPPASTPIFPWTTSSDEPPALRTRQ
jgi:hypothetical protein